MSNYDTQWTALLKEARATSESVAQECGFGFSNLVRGEFEKFARRSVPEDADQLESCTQEQMNLSAKIASIAGADKMAKAHRQAAPDILTATRAFCTHTDLRDHVVEEGMSLSTEVAKLCSR